MKRKVSISLSEELLKRIEVKKPKTATLSAWIESELREMYGMNRYEG